VGEFSRMVLPLFDSGAMVPIVHAVLPLERIQEAHQLIESSDSIGKIVLAVDYHDNPDPKSEL